MAENESTFRVAPWFDAQRRYEESFLELRQLVDAFHQVVLDVEERSGGMVEEPAWLRTVQCHLVRLEAASEDFLQEVHRAQSSRVLIAG